MSAQQQPPLEDSSICPWCSAGVPAEAAQCPSCGAALRDAVAEDIAGVTQVDVAATTRLARLKPPSRIAQWLGAEPAPGNPELSGSVEPPSEEVRKEMLKLELAAIEAELEAKATLAEAQRSLPPEHAVLEEAAAEEPPPDGAAPEVATGSADDGQKGSKD